MDFISFLPGLGIFIFIVIIFVLSFYSKRAKIKRRLKKAARVDIIHFNSSNPGKIVGKVIEAGSILKGPLSGRKCVYFQVEVQQKSGGKNNSWSTVIEDEKATAFYITDGTGLAMVMGEVHMAYLLQDANYNSGFLNDPSPRLEAYLHHHGVESTGIVGFNKTMQYKEGVLEIGEGVAVTGPARWVPTTDPVLREKFPETLLFDVLEGREIVLSDDTETFGSKAEITEDILD